MTTHDDRGTDGVHGFPGGKVALPRLSRPRRAVPGATEPDPVIEPPLHTPPAGNGGFNDYFSVDSLFGASPDPRTDPIDPDDPYAVLGLDRRATWVEVTQVRRRLVSQLHPDRFVDADPGTRQAAERRVRDVNAAFAEIRRQRSPLEPIDDLGELEL
jgi:hypothetical protein